MPSLAELRSFFLIVAHGQSDSPAFLNPLCLLKYVLNCEQNFSFFIFRFRLSHIWINCNRISGVYCSVVLYFGFSPRLVASLRAVISPIWSALGKLPFKGPLLLTHDGSLRALVPSSLSLCLYHFFSCLDYSTLKMEAAHPLECWYPVTNCTADANRNSHCSVNLTSHVTADL
jgi:hypothetical protein